MQVLTFDFNFPDQHNLYRILVNKYGISSIFSSLDYIHETVQVIEESVNKKTWSYLQIHSVTKV